MKIIQMKNYGLFMWSIDAKCYLLFWLKYSYQFFSSWWYVKDDVALKLSLSLHSKPLLLSLQAGLSLPLALCSEHKTDIISLSSLAPSSTGSAVPATWYRLVWQPWSGGGGGGVRVAVSPQLPFDTSSDISPKQSTFTVRPNVDLEIVSQSHSHWSSPIHTSLAGLLHTFL